eukprot:CAMPEP_0114996366 /NCGR_PEP_ID=MMETSP0216-20121206/14262_1 /TAXON_ID=223996 /ORGANISM="Protocruzia adherens, Strain Boccale" /LENGTH=1486 /DNA_ID=CAMNT_0002360545 /DNA_START=178 /DNA_END=4638 /DNA_ORIENTATION=+
MTEKAGLLHENVVSDSFYNHTFNDSKNNLVTPSFNEIYTEEDGNDVNGQADEGKSGRSRGSSRSPPKKRSTKDKMRANLNGRRYGSDAGNDNNPKEFHSFSHPENRLPSDSCEVVTSEMSDRSAPRINRGRKDASYHVAGRSSVGTNKKEPASFDGGKFHSEKKPRKSQKRQFDGFGQDKDAFWSLTDTKLAHDKHEDAKDVTPFNRLKRSLSSEETEFHPGKDENHAPSYGRESVLDNYHEGRSYTFKSPKLLENIPTNDLKASKSVRSELSPEEEEIRILKGVQRAMMRREDDDLFQRQSEDQGDNNYRLDSSNDSENDSDGQGKEQAQENDDDDDELRKFAASLGLSSPELKVRTRDDVSDPSHTLFGNSDVDEKLSSPSILYSPDLYNGEIRAKNSRLLSAEPSLRSLSSNPEKKQKNSRSHLSPRTKTSKKFRSEHHSFLIGKPPKFGLSNRTLSGGIQFPDKRIGNDDDSHKSRTVNQSELMRRLIQSDIRRETESRSINYENGSENGERVRSVLGRSLNDSEIDLSHVSIQLQGSAKDPRRSATPESKKGYVKFESDGLGNEEEENKQVSTLAVSRKGSESIEVELSESGFQTPVKLRSHSESKGNRPLNTANSVVSLGTRDSLKGQKIKADPGKVLESGEGNGGEDDFHNLNTSTNDAYSSNRTSYAFNNMSPSFVANSESSSSNLRFRNLLHGLDNHKCVEFDEDGNRKYSPGFFTKKPKLGISTIVRKRAATIVPSKNRENRDEPVRISQHVEAMAIVEEMENIDRQAELRAMLEGAIMIFNANPKRFFEFATHGSFISDSPHELAEFMLTTDGLDKELVGEILGHTSERSSDILGEYCKLFNFKDQAFDEALRLFLWTFRLPKEAQQIDRIIESFSLAFDHDNPGLFDHSDTAYILAYSLIMLHTDAHSAKIAQKRKMTKAQFITSNREAKSSLPDDYLEKMYDRITTVEFELHNDYIDHLYMRLQKQTTSMSGEVLADSVKEETLVEGSIFTKYGRRGKPKARKVRLSDDHEYIFWKDISTAEKERYILVKDIYDVIVGSTGTRVMCRNKIDMMFDSLCFSLCTPNRTLDLQAADKKTAQAWVLFLKQVVNNNESQKQPTQSVLLRRRIDEDVREKLTEVWKNDILPYWDEHWDYATNAPKRLHQEQRSKRKRYKSLLSLILCGCGRKNKKKPVADIIDSPDNLSAKGYFLVSIWRLGIPMWVRNKLWPIALGNRLEITENLYLILQERLEGGTSQSISQELSLLIDRDVMTATRQLKVREHGKDFNQFRADLKQLLHMFIIFRPDIPYAQGLAFVAAVFLLHSTNFSSFQSFANMLHSQHFTHMLKAEARRIKWTVDFFNEHFQSELPEVYAHFEALDLTCDFYLYEWLLSMFSKSLPFKIATRIWDNYFLDGEIFALQTALGILKYYERRLRYDSFNNILFLLRNIPIDIEENRLFDMIEDTDMRPEEFNQYLINQRKAHDKTEMLGVLLNQ